MRKLTLLLAPLASLLAAAPVEAQALQRGGGAMNAQAIAQRIFTQADRNVDQLLTRGEFRTADNMLSRMIGQMAAAGQFGRGQRNNFGGNGQIGNGQFGNRRNGNALIGNFAGGGAQAGRFVNPNAVTLPEFQAYVSAALARANAMSQGNNQRRGYYRPSAHYRRGYGRRYYARGGRYAQPLLVAQSTTGTGQSNTATNQTTKRHHHKNSSGTTGQGSTATARAKTKAGTGQASHRTASHARAGGQGRSSGHHSGGHGGGGRSGGGGHGGGGHGGGHHGKR